MKELSFTLRLIFYFGFTTMVVGGLSYALFIAQPVFCWFMLGGALAFSYAQSQQKYLGNSFVIRRLRRYMIAGSICFILSGLFMVEDSYHFFMTLFVNNVGNYMLYVKVFHNNWVVLMLIGALTELYTIMRISNELDKEKKAYKKR